MIAYNLIYLSMVITDLDYQRERINLFTRNLYSGLVRTKITKQGSEKALNYDFQNVTAESSRYLIFKTKTFTKLGR